MASDKFYGSFYVRMGLVLIALIFAGFIPFIKMRYDGGGSLNPLFLTHGILTLGWFVLFTYQASLVSVGNVRRHMALGKASLALTAAIVITGVMMMQYAFDHGSNGGTPLTPEHFIFLPFIDIVMFIIFYSLAFKNRFEADTHKHYMLLTGILIMDPAVARIGMSLGFVPLALLLHFGLLVLIVMHDRKKYGHVHKATKVGFVGVVTLYGSIILIGSTQAWAKLVHMVLG